MYFAVTVWRTHGEHMEYHGFYDPKEQKLVIDRGVHEALVVFDWPVDLIIWYDESGATIWVRIMEVVGQVADGDRIVVLTGPIPDSGIIPEGYGGAWGLSSPATWR